MTKKSGQSLIEFIISLVILVPFMSMLLSFSYLIYAKQITSYIHYRALLCTQELDKSILHCENRAATKLDRFLFFHKKTKTHMSSRRSRIQITTTGLHLKRETFYKKQLEVKIL